jgi:hypothetical protein
MAKRVDAKTQKAQKEKREKIMLGVLLAVLAVVAAVRVPGMLKSGGSGATTAATPTTSLPVMTGTGPGSTSGGLGLTGDQQYIPSDGQLAGLERLSGGNPFRVEPGASETNGAAAPTSTSSTATGTSTNPSENLLQPYLSATLSVNGVREEVNVRAQFPASSPFFVLASAAAKSVKITIAGGSLANGASSITIKKGESVTLANTADGTQFTITLISTSKKAATITSTSGSVTSTTSGSPPPPTVAGGTTPTA